MSKTSILLGKSIFWGLRRLGRTGSALPGLVVEKTNQKFLSSMLGTLPHGVFIVSGTNGKTTTTKIVAKLFESQGLRVLTNPTGSNFVRGIISVVVDRANRNGTLDYDVAVFEQDEAHAVHLARQVSPKGVLVLNIMRDQMDRFGEIDTTRQMLQKLVGAATDVVVLNANDERVSILEAPESARKVWFGHSPDLQQDFLTDDQLYHAESTEYFCAGKLDGELTGYDETSVSVVTHGTPHRYAYRLTGGHNALNLTAALTLVESTLHDIEYGKLAEAILTLEPAFGRGETISLDENTDLTLQLVKNPGGFTQALRMLQLKDYATVGIAINDDYPDGRDVSWLWDVSFETIEKPVSCGGTRAADMANRLKYDEVVALRSIENLEEYARSFAERATTAGGDAILFCTYTAMLKIRAYYLGGQSGLEGADA